MTSLVSCSPNLHCCSEGALSPKALCCAALNLKHQQFLLRSVVFCGVEGASCSSQHNALRQEWNSHKGRLISALLCPARCRGLGGISAARALVLYRHIQPVSHPVS